MLPFLASVALYLIFQSEKNSSMSEKKRQIIAGLIFGVTAIMATEFGVQTGGAILNTRNASPLCAGLFFGPWAGIISGIIGGVERWFCVYWGGAFFTRNGCALATILTGFIAAFLREKSFEKKIPEWELALYSGVFCETLDMILHQFSVGCFLGFLHALDGERYTRETDLTDHCDRVSAFFDYLGLCRFDSDFLILLPGAKTSQHPELL